MRIFFIFLFLFTLNCSSNKVANNHGFMSLEAKFEKIVIHKTNINTLDVSRLNPGTYNLQITYKNKIINKRIIKK